MGYGTGFHAPGVKSVEAAWRCTQHVLESHAAAAKHFRKKVPGGKLTMNLDGEWGEPLTESADDAAAAQTHRDYHHGMFADPLYLGHYPESVVRHNPPGLGKISPELAKELRASMVRVGGEKGGEREFFFGVFFPPTFLHPPLFSFFSLSPNPNPIPIPKKQPTQQDLYAVNAYTTRLVSRKDGEMSGDGLGLTNYLAAEKDLSGKLLGPVAESSWLLVDPAGFGKLLVYLNKR